MPRVLFQVERNNSRAMRSLKKVTKFLYTEEVQNSFIHILQTCLLGYGGTVDLLRSRLCLHEKFQPGSSSARVESLYDRQNR